VNALFVDTAGWIACADAGDPVHTQARAARDRALKAGQPLLTTDYVVDESLTLIRMRLGVSSAAAWWQQISASARLRWERIDGERFELARSLFFRYRDKEFSFTDCTSFVVMQQLRLESALTTDRHFRQMGFQLLPGRLPSSRRAKRR
jgi:predicted nucleic acid-binding protein